MTLNITGLQLSKVHSIVIFFSAVLFLCAHILIDICLQLRLSDLKKNGHNFITSIRFRLTLKRL
jgi:hypothetical protein